jgi:predicted metal-dependent hydrolase
MRDRGVRGVPEEIERGLALYERGEYFEAHEVMEEAWKRERKGVRRLYQGLIQACVACYHVRCGNGAGALKMIAAACPKLAAHRHEPCGADLDVLLAGLERLGNQIRSGAPLSSIELPRLRRDEPQAD